MSNSWFNFKEFKIIQEKSAFKVGTDGVLLGAWCNIYHDMEVLDVGTGTGLIALMLAQRSEANITAIEPDKLSAEEATYNILSSPWSKRINVKEHSLQSFVKICALKFDHIITNPPYFTESLLNRDIRLSKARHNHSLSGKELLRCSEDLLKPEGKLSVILPYKEANLLIADASEFGMYCNRMLNIKPLPGKSVKRILLEFSRKRSRLSTGILIVETGKRHEYSHEYKDLTKDFYLDF